jgi:hypothetical protein
MEMGLHAEFNNCRVRKKCGRTLTCRLPASFSDSAGMTDAALLMGKENITPYVVPETAERLSGIQYFQWVAGFRVRLSAAPE